jgi:hypothetical protein
MERRISRHDFLSRLRQSRRKRELPQRALKRRTLVYSCFLPNVRDQPRDERRSQIEKRPAIALCCSNWFDRLDSAVGHFRFRTGELFIVRILAATSSLGDLRKLKRSFFFLAPHCGTDRSIHSSPQRRSKTKMWLRASNAWGSGRTLQVSHAMSDSRKQKWADSSRCAVTPGSAFSSS